LGKSGKDYAGWLYEKEGENQRPAQRKSSDRELLSAPLVTTQKSGAANQDSRIILQEVTVGDTLLPSSSAVLFVGDE
jgi:hypothetical protein